MVGPAHSVEPLTDGGIRAGVDLVAVADVEASLARFGERYRRRVYTERELADAGRAGAPMAAALAARFAAKEAVLKVLQPDGDGLAWTDIEVRRRPDGSTEAHLAGRAATLEARAGVRHWAVSLTHESGVAAAVAVALVGPAVAGGEASPWRS